MKKLLCVLLTAAMLTATYSCGFAESSEEWKSNVGAIDLDGMSFEGEGVSAADNVVLITKGGDFTVTGTLEGMIKVNTDEKVKLRLSGTSITNANGPAIFFEQVEKGLITITENTENYLSDGSEYTLEDADAVLFSNDDLEIKGDGMLVIEANYKHGIASDDDLAIENGIISVTAYEHGIKANNTVSIIGGDIDVYSKTGKGVKAEEAFVMDGGDLSIVTEENEGIESKGTLDINGGNISIIAGEDGINTGNASTTSDTAADTNTAPQNNERPQMPDGMTPPEGMEMPQGGRGGRGGRGQKPEGMQRPEMNGEMTPPEGFEMPENGERPERPQGGMQGGFGRVDEETAAAHAVTITGGTVYINYINPESDGIDANGNLTISGGTVIIEGESNGMEGSLDSDGTMSITGGEVLILTNGGSMMLPNGDINSMRVYLDAEQAAETELAICDTDGAELISHTAKSAYKAVIFYSDDIEENKEYGVYADGELLETVTGADGAAAVGEQSFGGGMRGQGGRRPNQSGSEIEVEVDGTKVDYSVAAKPVIKNDTTLVGFRAILEMLGAKVSWDGETQTVTASKDGIDITLTINSNKATVNGEEKTLLTAPEIIDGSTMIPVRFISEQMGMNVEWNQQARRVSVKSK